MRAGHATMNHAVAGENGAVWDGDEAFRADGVACDGD
jgi:hypothetical protein